MSAVGPGQLRARSRPGLILGVAGLRALLGLCLAWPLASLVAASGLAARSQGDRTLFEDGGYLLLEVARVQGPALLAAARGLLPLLGLGLGLGAASSSALLVGLNQAERLPTAKLIERSASLLPRMLALGAGTALVQLVVLLVGGALVGAVPEPLARPVAASLGQLGVALGVALLLGAVGGVADVGRAALIRHGTRLGDALREAARLARQRPLQACYGWLPYAAVLVAAAAAVGKLAGALDVSRPGAWRVVFLFLAHQLVVLASVTLRAAWYARALRLSASAGGE